MVKAEAHRLGFLACGMARAEFLAEEAPRLEQWLREGRHGTMDYMARHFDLRLDPRKLVPGARTVISLAYNYFTEAEQTDPEAPKLSTYAYGRDYHKVVKKRLKPLIAFIQERFGDVAIRAFVDSAPVLEKAWAQRAGVGWQAKNANVISASSQLLRELSRVAKRREPKRWAMELIVTVAWNSTTVETKKPHTSSCGPLVPSAGAQRSSAAPVA